MCAFFLRGSNYAHLLSSFYSDLYGAIGYPLRVAKTIVVGKDSKLVEQVLNIISYFIRCTEVFEHVQKIDDGSKDGTHDKISSVEEESICSQCVNQPVGEVEHSGKSCLTSETGMCLKCIQKCDGNGSSQCEVKDIHDKEFLREEILKQLIHMNGLTCCANCGSRNNSSLESLPGVEMLQFKCSCNSFSNGGIRKELKHFIKDTSLSNQSFQCYCCNEPTDVNGILSKGTKCACFGNSECDSGNLKGKQDSTTQLLSKENQCVNCVEKLLMAQKYKGDLTKLAEDVQSKDVSSNCNGHTGNHISETDSCLSEDGDTSSVRSSVPERCSEVEETIASYGRSGSADSGIHQSPLNSPSAQRPADFPKVIGHQGEETQIPEELSLPKVVDVNCCPDPNR